MQACIKLEDIELDGPPPFGKPLEPQPVNASESKSEQDLLIEVLIVECKAWRAIEDCRDQETYAAVAGIEDKHERMAAKIGLFESLHEKANTARRATDAHFPKGLP